MRGDLAHPAPNLRGCVTLLCIYLLLNTASEIHWINWKSCEMTNFCLRGGAMYVI